MATKKTINRKIIKKARDYVRLVEKEGIKVEGAYLYGSWAKYKEKKRSDIDVAIISRSFSGDRINHWTTLLPLARRIDWRIEPMPFTPRTFNDENPLAWEIKRTGKRIKT